MPAPTPAEHLKPASENLSRWLRLPVRFLHAVRDDHLVRHRAGIVLAALLVCAYSLGVLVYVLATPEIGVRCAFTPVVNYFYEEEFLPTDSRETLERGDRITQIGPYPVKTWSQLLRGMVALSTVERDAWPDLSAKQLTRPEPTSKILIGRADGSRFVLVCFLRPGETEDRAVWCRFARSPIESVIPSVLWFFLKVGLFLVGAVLFWKKPDDRSAARFFWLCIVTLGAYMGGYHWLCIVTQPVLLVVFMSSAVLFPAATLHFYLVFPRPRPFFEARSRTLLAIIYGVPLFFLFLLLQGYFRLRWLHYGWPGFPDPPEALIPSAGVQMLLDEMLGEVFVYFAVAAVWYLASIASLLHSYRTAADEIERNQVKWILLGSALATIPLSYTLYLAFYETGRFGGGAATWPMFAASACVTIACTFSITRYRLLQLDQMISSGAGYFLISTMAGLIYYGVVFGGLLLVGSRGGDVPSLGQVLGVSTAALILMVGLDQIRGRLLRVLDKHLRREKYQLDRTLQRMSDTIERLVDTPTLGRHLLRTTADLLSAPTGAIYLRRGEPPLFQLTESLGPAPPLSELSPGCPLVEAVRNQTLVGPELNGSAPPARQLAFLGGTIAQGLIHEGQLQGLLVLGKRPEGVYTKEEVQILSAFARIAVLALVSADGHRTIESLNHDLKGKVEKIAEQQRRILALQSQLMKREDRKAVELAPPVSLEPPENGHAETHPALPASGLVGASLQVQRLMQLVRRVAASGSAVLLRGESGTGKELLARALHENSPRAGHPFIKVHCAALSAGLLESELFGHVKGAFTSAIRDKVGRFEAADSGTLFLDEIGDISLEVQTKLLRVLEEMEFERVGSSDPVHVDVRIIAATHRDLEDMIAEGKFREDLYFRLNVLPIHVPPLRDRSEDIPELAEHFLQLYTQKLGKPVKTIDDDALVALKGYFWPGNVRQLENVIERAVVIADGSVVGVNELPAEVRDRTEDEEPEMSAIGLTLPELASVIQSERADREKREREQLVRALAAAGGNKSEAARALGVARSTLVSRLKKLGLS